MNYFAHALPFLDEPYLALGTGVPDMLAVVDRKVRVRRRHAEAFVDDDDPAVAAVARGIVQHLKDDARFHQGREFVELSLELTQTAKAVLGPDSGFRPSFLGHLLVEILLDDALIAQQPQRLEQYYRVLGSADAGGVEAIVNQIAPRPTDRLASMIRIFYEHRVLSDYAEDEKLLVLLNRVMRRVKFAELPESFCELLPEARRKVAARAKELLEGIPT